MASIIQLRGGTAATWTTANPILAQKEMGIETDTNKIKLGDGTTAWTSLAYFETGEVTLSSSQVFTNKTITYASNTLTGVAPTSQPTLTGVKETKVAMAAHAIDLSLGNYFTNGGSAALTFFSGVTWAAATPPTLTAAGVDTLAFFTSDNGTTWRAFVLGLGMA